MKTTLHYSTRMTLYVYALGITSEIDLGCKSLDDTLEYVDCIFNNATMFHAECVDSVSIIDSDTGELIAECKPDGPQDDEVWPSPEEIFEDWSYNEDEGFNPYKGCYDYDC